MKPAGILAVNISNAYLALDPVMERAANAFDEVALVYHWNPKEDDTMCFSWSWTLIMDRGTAAAHPELRKGAELLRQKRPFRLWTDDFSKYVQHSEVGQASRPVHGVRPLARPDRPQRPINARYCALGWGAAK